MARRYYLDESSKVEIAGKLGLSRFKIARLLETARDSGLVCIEIGHPGLIDVNLAAQIMDRFGVKHVVVVDTPEDHADLLRRQLGQVAAGLLAEVIGPEDVLGIAWSRGVGAMAKALPRLSSVSVVQLTRAISMPDDDHSSIDMVAPVLGEGSWCHAPSTNRDNHFSSSLHRLSLASREEIGAPLGPAYDVDPRGDRRLLGGRGEGRGRTGLAGRSELREHVGQAPIALPGYPAGDDVVDQLVVGEYRQEEIAEVGRRAASGVRDRVGVGLRH